MYQPLDPQRRQIRLLRIVETSEDGIMEHLMEGTIEPSEDEPIKCSLHTVDFDDENLEFAALSYVWGDEGNTKNVLVDGHQRAVTENLESALRNFWCYFGKKGVEAIKRNDSAMSSLKQRRGLAGLRKYLASESCGGCESCDLHHESDGDYGGSEDEGDPVNEALSALGGSEPYNGGINIRDTLMFQRILCSYQRARVGGGNLPIWIDALCINQADPVEKSKQISMRREIFAKAESVFSWVGPPDHRNIDLALSTIRKVVVSLYTIGYSTSELSRDHPELCETQYWEAISNFANAEYFKRLWIFQELWAADHAVFLCGDEYLPIQSLSRYHLWAVGLARSGINPSSRPLTIPTFAPITKVYETKAKLKHAPIKTRVFLDIVHQGCCKDPRDKVFALFGIFRMDLSPDYTMPVADLYANWATNSFQDLPLGSLLFYSGIGLYPRPSTSHGLASWQPDFEAVGEQVNSFDTACAYRHFDLEVPPMFQPMVSQSRSLTCFGVRMRRVGRITAEAPKTALDSPHRVRGIHSKQEQPPSREAMLPLIKYLLDNRQRFWAHAYFEMDSPLYEFVETINESVGGGSPPTSDLTPDILGGFSARTVIKAARRQFASMDAPEDFTDKELEFMGFQSAAMLEECLDDLPTSLDGPRHTRALTQEHTVSLFAKRLWVFAFNKTLFYTDDGRLGAGPPNTKVGDWVYLLHGCSRPVLVRETEGKLRHVGVSYIPGLSDAASFEVLKGRVDEVERVDLV